MPGMSPKLECGLCGARFWSSVRLREHQGNSYCANRRYATRLVRIRARLHRLGWRSAGAFWQLLSEHPDLCRKVPCGKQDDWGKEQTSLWAKDWAVAIASYKPQWSAALRRAALSKATLDLAARGEMVRGIEDDRKAREVDAALRGYDEEFQRLLDLAAID